MDTCQVCKNKYKMGSASRNYVFEGYCSRYCYEFEKQNLSKSTVTKAAGNQYGKSRKTKQVDVWPDVPVVCQTCNQDFTLKYSQTNYNNSWFCRQECLKQVESHHKGLKNYHYLLPLYRSQDWMSASDIAIRNKYRRVDSKGSRSVGSCLKLWASRGVLKVDRSKQPLVYLWNYDGPVVYAMDNYKSI